MLWFQLQQLQDLEMLSKIMNSLWQQLRHLLELVTRKVGVSFVIYFKSFLLRVPVSLQ